MISQFVLTPLLAFITSISIQAPKRIHGPLFVAHNHKRHPIRGKLPFLAASGYLLLKAQRVAITKTEFIVLQKAA